MNKARSARSVQGGLTLVVVLIAVAMMALAAFALVRSIDTGSLVIGNLGFKQAATSAADSSLERAIAWLQDNNSGATLHSDAASSAYYATSLDDLDISGNSTATTRLLADWDNDSCAYAASSSHAGCREASSTVSSNGYSTNYIIMRMCKTSGDPNLSTNNCAKPLTSSSGGSSPKKGELKYGDDKHFSGASGPYYRIVVRSRGPRNTTSYTESYVHF